MRPNYPFLVFSVLCAGLFFAIPAPAGEYRGVQSTGITQAGQLDMPAVRKAYHESEFDWVKMVLESYLKKGSHVTKDEKTFAYKYLGVIYASEATAKNRAESYFNLLLNLSPDIELTDMFAPKSIEEFFHEVRTDRDSKLAYDKTHDAFGNPILTIDASKNSASQSSSSSQTKSDQLMHEKKTDHTWVWWGTGLAAVGVGTGLYLWMQSEPSKAVVTDTLSGGL